MAISRSKEAPEYIAKCSFTIDTDAEKSQLPTLTTGNAEKGWGPCLHGSTCLVNSTGKVLTIRGDNSWKGLGEA